MSVRSVLGEMEWDGGMKVPVANQENKQLEEQVQRKQQEIVRFQSELSEHEDRVFAMSEHMKNVQQELNQTQALNRARGNELDTENHMSLVASREAGRLKQEIQRLENDLADIKERRNIHENIIFKNTQSLEELKSQLNWDQQALEAWLEESARKDEDAMTLTKYTKMDDAKIKELSLRMERMTDESHKKRKHLEHEMTETLTAQLELDKTAEEFRKAHNNRQELISQWESTIEQMQRRDKEMDMLANELSEVKAEVFNNESNVKEKQQFLDNEVENNREQQKKLGATDRAAAKLRLDYRDAETQRIQFQDELETLKFTVARTATDLEGMRRQVGDLKRDVEDKKNRVENAKANRQDLMIKLEKISDASLTAEERAAMMDKALLDEEENLHLLDQELKRLRDLQYKKAQELFEGKTMEKNTMAEIQGSRAASRNLSSRINKLDHDSLKQQEIIYNQDFTVQQLERRIARIQGERSTEEMDQLNAKIKELTAVLEERNNTYQLVNTQLKRLQDDIRRVKRDLDKSGTEKADLTSKMEELNLHNDSSQRELKRIIYNKQDQMVEENILKLEIKRLRDQLNSRADDVFSLEKRRLQLETAMRERHHEISIHKEMLQAQLKGAEEERSTVSSELHERITKIDKLRKRYEILMVSMAPPEGEEDRSQAYYVIRAAQEKEELQRRGDELDAKIRKAEKEIKALENTLRLMNGRNEQYRKSFNRVTETSEEYEEKQRLDEQLRAAMDKYKYKRRQIRELQDDLQTMSNTMQNLTRDKEAYEDMIDEKENKQHQMIREHDEQKAKIDRVSKQIARYAREVRTAKKIKGESHEEKDFSLRELRDFNKNLAKQIGDVIHTQPDVIPTTHMLFSQAGLQVPPAPTGSARGHSRPGSAYSARSSASLSSRTASSVRSTASSRASSTAALRTVNLGGLGISGSGARTPKSAPRSPIQSPQQGTPGRVGSRPPSGGSQASVRSGRGSKH
ncbi:coiled-coil domain-containing protein 39-like [Asterias rubens]|uniref:coiled-coil domain-containing protein 39-like n=1 Tax=Asterias rubens TaxID=7604 RepID=UPI001455B992|nr:coiled-coil domain-containing protein 39-like [Asterias rubens]XP_033638040.1 coiled-coil domain-containing protein 39-like [Asterias rubens]